MRFRNLCESATREYAAYAGCVGFIHQVDAEHEDKWQSLFGRKLSQQRMLGAAGAATFCQHRHWIVARGSSPVRKAINETRCFSIGSRASAEKSCSYGTRGC